MHVPFPFAAFVLYPFTLARHSYEYDCMLNLNIAPNLKTVLEPLNTEYMGDLLYFPLSYNLLIPLLYIKVFKEKLLKL
jgi:hypothetical protein